MKSTGIKKVLFHCIFCSEYIKHNKISPDEYSFLKRNIPRHFECLGILYSLLMHLQGLSVYRMFRTDTWGSENNRDTFLMALKTILLTDCSHVATVTKLHSIEVVRATCCYKETNEKEGSTIGYHFIGGCASSNLELFAHPWPSG